MWQYYTALAKTVLELEIQNLIVRSRRCFFDLFRRSASQSHKVPVDMSHDHISKVTSLGKKEDGKEANELLNKACAQVQVSFNLYRTAILAFKTFF